jgi:PAS domain S-box-containing protein
MKPAATQPRKGTPAALPACAHCSALSQELQEAREQLAVLQVDVTQAERDALETLRELETSREQYAELYDFAPNSYLILDRNGIIRDANLTAAELLGVDRLKLRDTPFLRFVATPDRHHYLQHLSRCRRSRYPAQLATDLTLTCAGGPRQIHLLSVPDHRSGPIPRQIRYRTSMVDLSEIQRAEQALRDSESSYRLLFEQNPSSMYVFGENSLDILDVNEAALRLYGYSREAFLAMTIKELRPPELVPAALRAIRVQRRRLRTLNRQQAGSVPLFGGEWRHVKRDGTVFDVETSTSAIQYAGQPARLVLINDITARKQAEAALRESETRYRTIFDQAADGIVVFDAATLSLIDFNDESCRMLGYSRQQFAGMKISDLEALESPAEVKRHVRKFTMDHIAIFETKLSTGTGALMDIEVRAKVIYRSARKMIHCIWRDITASKQADSALRHRLELEQLLAKASNHLVNVPAVDLDTTVNDVLADVGRFLKADRCFLFRVTENLAIASNSHEWCGPDIRAQRADLQKVPIGKFPWLLARLREGKPLNIPRMTEIPRAAVAERKLMKQGQVQSTLMVPIRHSGKLSGFIGCDAVRDERQWPAADARLLQMIGVILADAQARCQADEALRSAAREWSTTFDGVSDAVWLLDADQRILRSNKAAVALFGKTSPQELLGRPCWELVHGTAQPIPGCPVTRMNRTRQRETLELARGERWYQVTADPLLAPEGTVRGAVHIVSDITARKLIEEKIRNMAAELERRVVERTAEVQRLAAIVQHSSELICLATPDMQCVFLNDSGARMLGIAAADIGQHGLFDFLPEEGQKRAQTEILPLLSQGQVWQGEMRYRNLMTGTFLQVALSAFPIPDPATGQLRYLAMTAVDISGRKDLEQQILEISDREQRRIGHDLHDSVGQHLAALKFMSATLSKRLARHKLASALGAAEIERELQLAIEEVRTIARGLHPVRPDGESLRSALHELAAGVTRLFKVPCHFACPDRTAVHDFHAATHLFRIAQEAVSNAARHARPRHIWIRLQQTHGRVRLSIEDDGCGLPTEAGRPKGMGLRIMSYRASVIGARFTLARRRSGGTRITCEWKPSPQEKAVPHAP